MTRDKMISELYKMAIKLLKNYDYDLENKMWDACSKWNASHEENEEIFMCETSNDNNVVNGFMIEDDCFYWDENTEF